MADAFTVENFVRDLGKRLVSEFEFSGSAGTPGLIGSAKEHPARKQFEKILPPVAGIGSGMVIIPKNHRVENWTSPAFD